MAMRQAVPDAVLGNFDDAVFRKDGIASSFFRRDDNYWVRTDGPDGSLQDYRIEYTFGWYPLQQYLIPFPGGRYQALGVAWDSRPAEQGGQRWFHLYPDQRTPAGDPLHWTGANQNWNYQCAECHSTDLRKGYDPDTDTFQTTYEEVNVGCEACHGPSSNHVTWAEARERGEEFDAGEWKGLVFQLGDPVTPEWWIEETTGIASRRPPIGTRSEVETCGRCHSRRSMLVDDYEYGRPLADTHQLALLEERLYHADGQILDEVFVYGSFVQSRMYAAGVSCVDCHDVHSTRVYTTGNALCARCHAAQKFDTVEHTFHLGRGAGTQCVDCHMVPRTYMVVDPRRDHSMRVPRPDLTVKIGVPNACNDCHVDRTAVWAAELTERWYGAARRQRPHYGEALHAARRGDPAAARGLVELINDSDQPGIARATALELVERYPSRDALDAIRRALGHGDPLIRIGAVRALRRAEAEVRLALVRPLLRDRVLAVRLQATATLASLPLTQLPPEVTEEILAGVDERIRALRTIAERPEAWLNIGVLYAQTGRLPDAEAAYQHAISLAPGEGEGYVNLADLYRAQGRDAEGELLLREARRRAPENTDIRYALGLLLVRRSRMTEAAQELAAAYATDPGNARYALAYALTLQDGGDLAGSLEVLRQAAAAQPYDTDILLSLVQVSRDSGRLDEARSWASRLLEIMPSDPSIRALVQELQSQ